MLKGTIVSAMLAAVIMLFAAPATAQDTGYQLDNLSDTTAVPGQAITVHANGFPANCEVTITLLPTPVLLATVVASDQGPPIGGVVNASVVIPADTSLGDHSIVLTCVNGLSKVVTFPIVVVSSTTVGGVSLAITGANITLMIAIGAVALGAGASLLASVHRRESV